MSMTSTKKASPPEPSREERIEAIMQQLRPGIEQLGRQMVERAVDVPEAEEFGAIDAEFRQDTIREQATASIFEYVEAFDNRVRRHSSLGFVSIAEYERMHYPKHP
jgi:hypothetical protein